MTYIHKREKCAQETNEILEEVLKESLDEEYGCLDCADTIEVGNPMKKILSEESPKTELRSKAEEIMEETQEEATPSVSEDVRANSLETYIATDEVRTDEKESTKKLQKKKKGAYIEFKKDYRG